MSVTVDKSGQKDTTVTIYLFCIFTAPLSWLGSAGANHFSINENDLRFKNFLAIEDSDLFDGYPPVARVE